MALTGKTNDEKIWNYLKSNGFNEFGTAGLMGESVCRVRIKTDQSAEQFREEAGAYR